MTRARVPRSAALVLLIAYSVFLAFVLLNPSAAVPSTSVDLGYRIALRLGFSPALVTPTRVEFLCNVALLVPLSVLGSLALPRWSWQSWTATGFLLAGGIELTQGLLLPARDASYADVVANTLGAMLGGWLVLVVRLVLHPSRIADGRTTMRDD